MCVWGKSWRKLAPPMFPREWQGWEDAEHKAAVWIVSLTESCCSEAGLRSAQKEQIMNHSPFSQSLPGYSHHLLMNSQQQLGERRGGSLAESWHVELWVLNGKRLSKKERNWENQQAVCDTNACCSAVSHSYHFSACINYFALHCIIFCIMFHHDLIKAL